LANSSETNILLIYYRTQHLNRSFVYSLNGLEQQILRLYIRDMLNCPMEKFIALKLQHCPYANELNPYVYTCCFNGTKFMSIHYYTLNLRGYEVTSLLRVLEANV
jgi:hypothetical protein